ncbi:S49 family peptidase [Ralstonia insidiosa]|uniref:Peptidase S49 n=1 Tax=Ralstonia insidiosa TaxID=190721 RepID=A0A191ZY21_9RALS|nr:S49 family peptidase [Ralstonia insidiosa]ANJ72972.1 peptidase S49 [Ralstonia insidiosa]KAB0473425.1 S49 family peptidase [Ralstonia insidiosa]MBY4911491.1 S49 family peptidase [Ralstonia insidiosa]
MTDSNPPKGPENAPEEGAGKPEALEVTRHADHPLEAELRDSAAGKPASAAPASAQAQPSGWEREVLEKVLMATVREQRAARRWRIFFRFVLLGIVGLILWAFASFEGETVSTGRHTAVVNLDGEIAASTNASAENINASLEAAFADDNTVGVILKINSPGGSPVQAGMINDDIRRLRAKYKNIPLYVVVEEMCASGGYYVAAAADKIYVDKASIVGSIGVLMDGFGFTGLMDKVGVERRLLTAGSNKGMLDPFSPVSPQQKQYAQDMLNDIHQQFIDVVKQGRGNRLKDDPTLFTGLFWTGSKAIELGLADGLGSADFVARNVIKAPDVVDYTVKENFASRVARKLGTAMGAGAVKALAATGQLKLLMKE